MKKIISIITIVLSVIFLASCIEVIAPDDVTGINLNFTPREAFLVEDSLNEASLFGKTVTVHFSNKDPETFNATDTRIQLTGDVVGSGSTLALDTRTVGAKTASFSFGGVSVTIAFFVADARINKAVINAPSVTVSTIVNSLSGISPVNQKVVYIENGVYQGAELGTGTTTTGAINEVFITTNNVLLTTSSINPATLINLDNSAQTVFDIRGTGITIENFIVVRYNGISGSGQAIAIRNSDTTVRNLTLRGGDSVAQKTNHGITVHHGYPGTYNLDVSGIEILDNLITGFETSIAVESRRNNGATQGKLSDVLIEGNTLENGGGGGIQIVYSNDYDHSNPAYQITDLVITDNSIFEDNDIGLYLIDLQIWFTADTSGDFTFDWSEVIEDNRFKSVLTSENIYNFLWPNYFNWQYLQLQ